MRGARGAGDVLVHQRAAGVVDAGLQQLREAAEPELDPGGLDVVDVAAVGDPADRVHQHDLAERRAAPGARA